MTQFSISSTRQNLPFVCLTVLPAWRLHYFVSSICYFTSCILTESSFHNTLIYYSDCDGWKRQQRWRDWGIAGRVSAFAPSQHEWYHRLVVDNHCWWKSTDMIHKMWNLLEKRIEKIHMRPEKWITMVVYPSTKFFRFRMSEDDE